MFGGGVGRGRSFTFDTQPTSDGAQNFDSFQDLLFSDLQDFSVWVLELVSSSSGFRFKLVFFSLTGAVTSSAPSTFLHAEVENTCRSSSSSCCPSGALTSRPGRSDVTVNFRTLWHHCRLWLQVQHWQTVQTSGYFLKGNKSIKKRTSTRVKIKNLHRCPLNQCDSALLWLVGCVLHLTDASLKPHR